MLGEGPPLCGWGNYLASSRRGLDGGSHVIALSLLGVSGDGGVSGRTRQKIKDGLENIFMVKKLNNLPQFLLSTQAYPG